MHVTAPGGIDFAFFYDPRCILLRNASQFPLELRPQQEPSGSPSPSPQSCLTVNPRETAKVAPGYWEILCDDKEIMRCRCIASNFDIMVDEPEDRITPSGKRKDSAVATEVDNSGAKRFKGASRDLHLIPRRETKLAPCGTSTLFPHDRRAHIVHRDASQELPTEEYVLTRRESLAITGSAEVFAAVLDSGQESRAVVAKFLRLPAGVTDENEALLRRIRGFDREYVGHKELDHPSIVRLVGADSRIYAIYVDRKLGHDLAHMAYREPEKPEMSALDVGDVVRILADVADALEYLHLSRNMAHNDIKPRNIMFSRQEGASIIDLGLAGNIGDRVKGAGTPWYIAPETVADWTRRGPQADVWALGITMLFLLKHVSLPDLGIPFRISDLVAPGTKPQAYQKATTHARTWLTLVGQKVRRMREPNGDKTIRTLNELTTRMLESDPEKRVDSRELASLAAGLRQELDLDRVITVTDK